MQDFLWAHVAGGGLMQDFLWAYVAETTSLLVIASAGPLSRRHGAFYLGSALLGIAVGLFVITYVHAPEGRAQFLGHGLSLAVHGFFYVLMFAPVLLPSFSRELIHWYAALFALCGAGYARWKLHEVDLKTHPVSDFVFGLALLFALFIVRATPFFYAAVAVVCVAVAARFFPPSSPKEEGDALLLQRMRAPRSMPRYTHPYLTPREFVLLGEYYTNREMRQLYASDNLQAWREMNVIENVD